MVTKVAGGIIGLGLIGTGSVAMAKPEWFGINKEVPWTPLSKDHSFSSTGTNDYGTDKFGGKYKGVLTGVVGTDATSGDKNTNEDWWNKSFEQLKADSRKNQVSDKFKYSDNESDSKVNKGTSANTSQKGLNQICNEAYKKDSNKITENGSDDGYKEADVWKYCSPLGEKLKTISDSDSSTYTTDGTIGHDTTNNQKLVSTTGNKKFWEIREKEFRGVSKYQKIEETKDAFFDPDKGKSIKELCGEAYGKNKNNNNDSTSAEPKKDKVLKYCSINKE